MTDEVKFTDEQWDKVAEAAEVFATTLENEGRSLKDVLKKNWAGDCDEGLGTFENLRQLLQGEGSESFNGVLDAESTYLRGLANQCRNAKDALSGEDLNGAHHFKSAP